MPETVRDIVRRLPREVHTVGVFRDERPERIVEIVERAPACTACSCTAASRASEVQWIRERVQFVIQAFAAGDPALASAAQERGRHHPRRLARSRFGQGVRLAARRRARRAACGCCSPAGSRQSNVGEAIRRVRPWGVDVSTGVEVAPGRKDPRKLRAVHRGGTRGGRELGDRRSTGAIDLDRHGEVGGRHPSVGLATRRLNPCVAEPG